MFGLNRRKRRLEAVIGRVAGERVAQGGRGSEADRRRAIQAKLKEVEAKRSGQKKFRLADALTRAGLKVPPLHFGLGCAAAGAVGFVLGSSMSTMMAFMGALFAGLGVPSFMLNLFAKRRLKKFTGLFADSIDIIVRGVRSGLPLGECLKIIGREMPEPCGSEFRLVTEGIRLGMTVEESLIRMTERVPTAEVRFFAIVIAIQQQTGGNLADTLSKLSDVLRARKRMRDKIVALSSEAKASAGIIGSLPFAVGGLLTIISPEYTGLLFTTSAGNTIIAIGCLFMGVGIMVMRGMINFEM